jgi:hypothetical protein
MTRTFRSLVLLSVTSILGLIFFVPEASAELQRVARKVNYFKIKGGYTMPVGKVSGYQGDSWADIFRLDEPSPNIKAEDVYKDTWSMGIDYGFLRYDHIAFSFGFQYTGVPVQDSVVIEFDTLFGIVSFNTIDVNVNLYDITLNADFYPLSPFTSKLLPYVGAGLSGGLLVFSGEGTDAETGLEFASTGEVELAAHVNFGVDFKVWENQRSGSFVTLSSDNSYEFWSSDYRPAYGRFNFGIKYFLKP